MGFGSAILDAGKFVVNTVEEGGSTAALTAAAATLTPEKQAALDILRTTLNDDSTTLSLVRSPNIINMFEKTWEQAQKAGIDPRNLNPEQKQLQNQLLQTVKDHPDLIGTLDDRLGKNPALSDQIARLSITSPAALGRALPEMTAHPDKISQIVADVGTLEKLDALAAKGSQWRMAEGGAATGGRYAYLNVNENLQQPITGALEKAGITASTGMKDGKPVVIITQGEFDSLTDGAMKTAQAELKDTLQPADPGMASAPRTVVAMNTSPPINGL